MTAPSEQITLCLAEADNAPGEPCILNTDHNGRHQDTNGQTWAHSIKYGRPDIYEITWMSGHIERVLAHQVTWPGNSLALFGGPAIPGAACVRMHAEIAERWTLTLSAREEDIRTMRLVTDGEPVPGGTS